MESLTQRIIRHLRNPQEIDWRTIQTGIKDVLAAWERMQVHGEEEGFRWTREENFMGVRDLELTRYKYLNTSKWLGSEVTFTSFPLDSRLKIFVMPRQVDEIYRDTDTFAASVRRAIGSFTGPTYENSNRLPNNGFFHWPQDVEVFPDSHEVFMQTENPKERRGAIALTHDGQVRILDDEAKWQIINTYEDGALGRTYPYLNEPHPEFEALVGTSCYFSRDEEFGDGALTGQHGWPGSKSYLIQDETGRLTHAVFGKSMDRAEAKLTIDHWAEMHEVDWRAAELEYNHSNTALVRPLLGGTVTVPEDRDGFHRRDHYVMVRDK